jgi:cysteinyl-tRNA synthetase
MNVTDVGHLTSDADEGEDKLENGAARENKTVWEVADHYTQAFRHDVAALGILPPTENPHRSKNTAGDPYARATDFIPEQIAMIQALLDKNFAYKTNQAIYFDVAKLPNYGELSGQKLVDKETGARSNVVTDPHKHSPHDFAVWFFTVGRYAEHTMRWPSPWGSGFPGWHLECSAIIHATLGDPVDIHTGGIDHIGTHHPNEMAQTEAAYDHPLAKMWVHNEFILVDGAKMSKSKGNSYTLQDITDRGYSHWRCASSPPGSHRSELNFTWDSPAAQNTLHNLYA